MHDYGIRDVERLLHLSRSTIRSLVQAGFVSPSRGARNSWRFSFQDLIVLRTAQALVEANVPKRRITKSVRELRRHLPDSMPLSGLSISAVGDRVAVREGTHRWQADSGQYLLEFDWKTGDRPRFPDSEKRGLSPVSAQEWFERGVALEGEDVEAAIRAYRQAIAADPALLDASLNLGRLLHELERFAPAEQVYRDALKRGRDALLQFNLAVLFEDMSRRADAVKAYLAALRLDPALADAHCNLALLYEKLGRNKEAIRHMAAYRRLADR